MHSRLLGEYDFMTLTISQWHQRYLQQARWTQSIRKHIYDQAIIQQASKVLDIGCGTGVLENELNQISPSRVFGVDIDFEPLQIAKEYAPKSTYIVGDCSHLPYQNGEFDITMCHFLLLWVGDPLISISEMARVTRPKGFVLALAEPDYGGRIDYPAELSQIGAWQMNALKQQGANPLIGRETRSIFSRAGLVNIEVGILGGQWLQSDTDRDFDLEWDVLRSDLLQNSEFIDHADQYKALEVASREAHQRILFVPTFYAFGMVPT
jgi:ubiquinone/menaquinone biosynthesis C-methylase UbiE